jgi:NAD(P)-dependent dehydrogenase (short-subunit alcohol dehydrogenase family)
LAASRVAVVTGAGRGIGAATARHLAAAGYAVLAVSRTPASLAVLQAQAAGIAAEPADVAVEDEVERVARRAETLGRLEAWVNAAAVVERTPFAELDAARWRRILSVDLDGVFLCCRAAFGRMSAQGGGSIVNIASLSGVANVEKFPGLSAYNVAKAGVIALSEAVALEGRPLGVRCVCVSPGAVDTEMLRAANPQLRAGMTADDMAAIIAFLLSDAAAPLSGSNIPIFSNA